LLKQTKCETNTTSMIVPLKFTCVALVSCTDINCSLWAKVKMTNFGKCVLCVKFVCLVSRLVLLGMEGAELIEHGSTAEPGFRASDPYDYSCSVAGLNCIVQELRKASARAHLMVVATTLTQIVTRHSRNVKIHDSMLGSI